jgi:hypothetical protein
MADLVQIEKGWQRRRMKETGFEFLAKKTEGGGLYYIKIPPDQNVLRHVAEVIETLSEEIK